MLAVIGGFLVLATLALPWLGMNLEIVKPLLKDPFAVANLEAQVKWTMWDFLPGLFLLEILFLSLRCFGSGKLNKGFLLLFLGTAIFTNLALIFFIKKIEGYTQRAAVEFCKSLEGENCYVRPVGHKSYVHLFYTKKMPPVHPLSRDVNWLLAGEMDKDVYFITKIHKVEKLGQAEGLEEIGRKNGFVFFKRRRQ